MQGGVRSKRSITVKSRTLHPTGQKNTTSRKAKKVGKNRQKGGVTARRAWRAGGKASFSPKRVKKNGDKENTLRGIRQTAPQPRVVAESERQKKKNKKKIETT